MTSISEIVSVQITTTTTGVTQANFGRPCLAAYHTRFAERTRLYTSLQGLIDDGFLTSDPTYKMAQRLLSARPRVKDFLVGRRASAFSQTTTLTPTDTTEGLVYTVKVTGPSAATSFAGETFTYTNGAAETVSGITAGLVTAMAAATGDWTPTDNTTDVSIAADNPGDLFNIQVDAYMDFKDDTTAPGGLLADLESIVAENDSWYCLALDSCSQPEAEATAGWTATRDKIFVAHTADSDVLDSVSTTDVAANFQSSAYKNSGVWFNRTSGNLSYYGLGIAGVTLPKDPGTLTWAYKTVSGVSPDTFSAAERASALGKDANIYETIGGVNVSRYGTVGSGEYYDVTRYIHFLTARLQERLYSILVNNDKLPYTNASVDIVVGEIRAQLQQGVDIGALRAGFEVTAPLVEDVDNADKIARNLPDVEFSAELAGAIHTIEVQGTVSA